MDQDITEKRAMYVAKNNELVQEFSFAHHKTKIWVNNVFNTSFYSSPLWGIFTKDYRKLEKSWNVSQRVMLNLPRTTHRYFLEPLTKTMHITKSLKKRFINFINKIKEGKKMVLRKVLQEIEKDCRSTTGRNIRQILLAHNALELSHIDINKHPYMEVKDCDTWKIGTMDEIINIKSGSLHLPGFTKKEVDAICEFLCND